MSKLIDLTGLSRVVTNMKKYVTDTIGENIKSVNSKINNLGNRLTSIDGAITSVNEAIESNELTMAAALVDLDNRVTNVEKNGGGSNSGNSGSGSATLTPTYSDGMAFVVGVDSDMNSYYSDVYIEDNSVNAPNGFFQQSDERLKTFVSDVEVDLEKISKLPKKYFLWQDGRDEDIHLGTSAQAVQDLYPELVKADKKGNLTVDYAKLSIIALKAIDILNEERKQMKNDIAEIKTKLGL